MTQGKGRKGKGSQASAEMLTVLGKVIWMPYRNVTCLIYIEIYRV